MQVKHPRLEKNKIGQLIFYTPTQYSGRNTESIYVIETNTLTMAGIIVNKHPKFSNIEQFENWCNRYWANHY